ncbi:PRC-barrel domain-containing protein [Jannaschia rubra]|uniref:PRC-barrel domain protein n=1 Tax=Jannaschia rubra TaxID=282197 RepID=A0A0M6XKW5_9RHOB|nr:PRC-barrel domain-containing protein [Jannaschia rubra]CTQ31786.1 PRC-barrel domain protein [Jannaschia rubra]SFG53965.1 PRC-barrel domain-containing protein [Jannaschia rubra]
MLRTLSTAALAVTLAVPAFAQDMADMSDLIRSRDITGGPVYSIANNYDENTWLDLNDRDSYGYNNYGYGTDYNQIGEIEDVILDKGGQMVGIVAEVGGFLDIGDKHVMVPVDDIRLVAVDDASYSYVTRLSEEQLEELPSVDEGWWD